MQMESKRLIIRKSLIEDCALFAQWESMWEVNRWFTMDTDPNYHKVLQEFILRNVEKDMLQFTIVKKDGDEPIGRIWISQINDHYDSLDISRIYIADPAMRGQGYGEEALRTILEYCFIRLHRERVTLDHIPDNEVAAALYTKLGFQYEGIARHAGKKDGRYVDLKQMSMLRSEYAKMTREG
ncbi:MAG: GNAT family N-acetyltransferase [Firmicutes bacterium]|nr:GNAT family N-acetyltransferase [Bacillota bacterium]